MITAAQLAAALRAAADSLDGAAPQQQYAAPVQQYAAPQQQPPPQQYAAPQQQPPPQQQAGFQAPPNLTGQQLVDLIQPHIVNDAIKAALGQAMRNNGVANLPDAQPHQYAALYVAFQQVLAQFGIGAPQQAAPQQAAPQQATSII